MLFSASVGFQALLASHDDAKHLDGHPENSGDAKGGGCAKEEHEFGVAGGNVALYPTEHEKEENRNQEEVDSDGNRRYVLLFRRSVDVVVPRGRS